MNQVETIIVRALRYAHQVKVAQAEESEYAPLKDIYTKLAKEYKDAYEAIMSGELKVTNETTQRHTN